ncbi:hypothetical protein Plec18167_005117 [Paecilomyces lecythidis]|uniref:Uncharacterized protein n=1 Tax=Paecilomyces lecythidis TaxID=3004212 RepID=A0ABR3XM79_9EURO
MGDNYFRPPGQLRPFRVGNTAAPVQEDPIVFYMKAATAAIASPSYPPRRVLSQVSNNTQVPKNIQPPEKPQVEGYIQLSGHAQLHQTPQAPGNALQPPSNIQPPGNILPPGYVQLSEHLRSSGSVGGPGSSQPPGQTQPSGNPSPSSGPTQPSTGAQTPGNASLVLSRTQSLAGVQTPGNAQPASGNTKRPVSAQRPGNVSQPSENPPRPSKCTQSAGIQTPKNAQNSSGNDRLPSTKSAVNTSQPSGRLVPQKWVSRAAQENKVEREIWYACLFCAHQYLMSTNHDEFWKSVSDRATEMIGGYQAAWVCKMAVEVKTRQRREERARAEKDGLELSRSRILGLTDCWIDVEDEFQQKKEERDAARVRENGNGRSRKRKIDDLNRPPSPSGELLSVAELRRQSSAIVKHIDRLMQSQENTWELMDDEIQEHKETLQKIRKEQHLIVNEFRDAQHTHLTEIKRAQKLMLDEIRDAREKMLEEIRETKQKVLDKLGCQDTPIKAEPSSP